MFKSSSLRTLIFLWLAWALILIGFQQVVIARLELQRPDYALFWTPSETQASTNHNKPTLSEPFLNTQAAWDSEFYLSIATRGYDDSAVRRVIGANLPKPFYSLNYAFMPLYPLLIRLLAYPLSLFGMNAIATATLAGVLVSLLGTLTGMLGIYALTKEKWGEEGGIRAAFYLLIFPSGFYLAQIYTEGLFIGLVFGSLALLQKQRWWLAGLLAAASVWTRPGEGALLLLPMWVLYFKDQPWAKGWKPAVSNGLASLLPAVSYFIWTLTPLADRFWIVEDNFFSRGLLKTQSSLYQWGGGFASIFGNNPQMAVYYGIELIAILITLVSIILLFKERPELSLFSLAVLVFTFTSGSAQGMVRYVLAAPCLFMMLAGWGRKPAFDRAWTIASVLLMGMLAMLFSFDFWVA